MRPAIHHAGNSSRRLALPRQTYLRVMSLPELDHRDPETTPKASWRLRWHEVWDHVWSAEPIEIDRRALRRPRNVFLFLLASTMFVAPTVIASASRSAPRPFLAAASGCALRGGRPQQALQELNRFILRRRPKLPVVSPNPDDPKGENLEQIRLRASLEWFDSVSPGPASLAPFREDLRAVRLHCGWVLHPEEVQDGIVLQMASSGIAVDWTNAEPLEVLSRIAAKRTDQHRLFLRNGYLDVKAVFAWGSNLATADPSYAELKRWIPQIEAMKTVMNGPNVVAAAPALPSPSAAVPQDSATTTVLSSDVASTTTNVGDSDLRSTDGTNDSNVEEVPTAPSTTPPPFTAIPALTPSPPTVKTTTTVPKSTTTVARTTIVPTTKPPKTTVPTGPTVVSTVPETVPTIPSTSLPTSPTVTENQTPTVPPDGEVSTTVPTDVVVTTIVIPSGPVVTSVGQFGES